MEHLLRQSKCNNLIVIGVPESTTYSLPAKLERHMQGVLFQAAPASELTTVRSAYRWGKCKEVQLKPRAVLVELVEMSVGAKDTAFQASSRLRAARISSWHRTRVFTCISTSLNLSSDVAEDCMKQAFATGLIITQQKVIANPPTCVKITKKYQRRASTSALSNTSGMTNSVSRVAGRAGSPEVSSSHRSDIAASGSAGSRISWI